MRDKTAAELKVIATEQGVEFETNYGQKKMLEVLGDARVPGFYDPEPSKLTGNGHMPSLTVSAASTASDSNMIEANVIMKEYNALINTFKSTPNIETRAQKEMLRRQFLAKTEDIKRRLTKISADDELVKVLRFERERKMLPAGHEYKLNELDSKRCNLQCRCTKVPKASGLFLELNEVYAYSKQYSEEKNTDVYTIFITRTIEPESQIGKELDWKIKQGFMPEQKDYPKEKIQYRRTVLVAKEFDRYFELYSGESAAIF